MNSDPQNNLEVNLYFIKSNFKDILARIGKKIMEGNECFLVNFDNDQELTDADKHLWLFEKDSFLPHQIFNEKLSKLDRYTLFKGHYKNMERFKNLKNIIVSPRVKVSKFEIFQKFMLFSNNTLNEDILKNIKDRLLKNKIEHKIYYEYNSFKWKLVN